MNKKEAVAKFEKYMKDHQIKFRRGIDNGYIQCAMLYQVEQAPNKVIESCVWFYDNEIEIRCYYTEMGSQICKESVYKNEAYRLLNYINARVFLSCYNELYGTSLLYTPRLYITEDGGDDITITTMIPYDFWELAPIETMDYMTAYCPEVLGDLTMPIFGVLSGTVDVNQAITYIEKKVLSR